MDNFNDQPKLLPRATQAALRRQTYRVLSTSSFAILVAPAFATHFGIIPFPGEEIYPHHLQPYTAPDGSFSAQIPAGWQLQPITERSAKVSCKQSLLPSIPISPFAIPYPMACRFS